MRRRSVPRRAARTSSRPGLAGAALAALLTVVLVPAPAHAYIDPASGSLVLQVVAAGVLAALLTMKRIWRKLAGLLPGRRGSEHDSD